MSTFVHIRNETNELRLLFEVCLALEGTADLPGKLEKTLALMGNFTGMHYGSVWLQDEAGSMDCVARQGDADHVVLGNEAGLIKGVAATGQALALPDSAQPVALTRGSLRDVYKEEVRSLAVPLESDGRRFGALYVDRLFADSVAIEEDLRLLQVLAGLISQAARIRREFEALHSAVVEENRRLQALVSSRFNPQGIVGNSTALRSVFAELMHVADSTATVLIRGESGTGKELVASTIHANSSRSGKPFIRVNCAALPEGLVESELFGHERGAFTGATGVRKGRFEMAHGGTLFLDEVGDLTPLTQAKVLRALQEKEFERVGGTETRCVDVRLIAATNRDLEAMVADGSFRQDLYYRLSVFPIMLPPLRERREDIMPLATHFADKYGKENQRTILRIDPAATSLLMAYSWPGNIRELENVMERATLVCGADGVISARHLPPSLQGPGCTDQASPGGSLDAALADLEKRMITEALREEAGNMAKASARLGITERIMGLRMKKYDLSFKDFRNSGK